jgi:hypothetical protein
VDDSKTTSMCRDVGVTACEGKQRLLFLSENVSEPGISSNYLFSSSVFICIEEARTTITGALVTAWAGVLEAHASTVSS